MQRQHTTVHAHLICWTRPVLKGFVVIFVVVLSALRACHIAAQLHAADYFLNCHLIYIITFVPLLSGLFSKWSCFVLRPLA